MPLPKLNHPIKKIKVPSTGKEIEIRPMTVKEEKISLMANESSENLDKILAVSQIIRNCIVTENFDFKNCASFDAEYIYLHIMGFSVQNIYNMKYTDSKGEEIPFSVNVEDVNVIFPEKKINSNIQLTDKIGVKMRYLTFEDMEELSKKEFKSDYEESFETTKKSIEFVYDENEIYEDFTDKELEEFIENLDSSAFEKIIQFFSNIPYLYYTTEIKDSSNKKIKIELKGLSDFFSF